MNTRWPNPLPARNDIRFESPDGDRASIVLPIVPPRTTALAEPYLSRCCPATFSTWRSGR